MSFKIRHLALAIATFSPLIADAAGLDRSTQPSWGFTQDGTFAYIEHITIDPKVKGKDTSGDKVPNMADDYHFLNFGAKADVNDRVSLGVFFDQPWGADARYKGDNIFVAPASGEIASLFKLANVNGVTDVNSANTYITSATQQLTAGQAQVDAGKVQLEAAKTQLAQAQAALAANPALESVLQPRITAGQAQIAAAQKTIDENQAKITAGQTQLAKLKALTATANKIGSDKSATNVQVRSKNFTGVLGLKLGDKKQFQIYGGPTLEKLEGDVHLRGDAYSIATGYDAGIFTNTAYGWMAGAAYSKPEIGLKAAVTYRSEIEHKAKAAEYIPLAPLYGLPANQTSGINIKMPKSVNVDFQTGLNPTTLLTAKLRWVPWSDFSITPNAFNNFVKSAVDPTTGKKPFPNGLPLLAYDKDSWAAELGLGKKLNDKWAVSGSVGWDSGAGNPVSSLGPVEGNWNVGLGVKYNITPEWAVSGGAKYLMFGDAKGKVPTEVVVGDFQNNNGWVYGARLTYQKK